MNIVSTTHRAAAFVAVLLAASLLLSSPARAGEDPNVGLFINLSTVDAVPAGHALQFAGKIKTRGYPVVVFLNGKAVWIATRGAPQFTYPVTGETLQAMVRGLIADGVEVIVCHVCATLRGVGAGDLIDGAPLGNSQRVSDRLFDPAYKVISW